MIQKESIKINHQSVIIDTLISHVIPRIDHNRRMSFIVEGIDRSGKDTFIENLLSSCKALHTYTEDPIRKREFVGNPEKYKEYIRQTFSEKIIKIKVESYVVLNRFHVSEYVFSTFFNRELVIAPMDEFEKSFLYNPPVIFYLDISYATYLERLKEANEVRVYSEIEFIKICDLYKHHIGRSKFPKVHIHND